MRQYIFIYMRKKGLLEQPEKSQNQLPKSFQYIFKKEKFHLGEMKTCSH